jgi:hypothetical protein
MLVNLRALFARLLDIVLLRGGPEQLPASPGLLVILVLVNGALSVLIAAFIATLPDTTIIEFIVGSLVPLLWFYLAFSIVKKPERFVQTMIAYFGINILFQPVVAPMLAALRPYMEKQDPSMPAPAALSLLFLLVGVWVITVWVRIVRSAFEWPIFVAIIFVFAQNLVTLYIYATLFGVSAAKI